MKRVHIYRVLVVLFLLALAALEWRNHQKVKELEAQQENLLKRISSR